MKAAQTTDRRLLLGYLAAVGAAVSYGAVSLVARKIGTEYSPPLVGAAFSMLFGTMIVALLFHGHVTTDAVHAPRRACVMVGLAGCAGTWGVSFWFLALSEAPVVLVAPLAGTHPLISVVLAHLFLQRLERVTWRTALGALLVVGGVVVIALGTE